MKDVITYVGIDAHKKELFIARLVGDQAMPPVQWKVLNEPQSIRRLIRQLEREAPGEIRVFYEAGPCGYALQRQLTTPRIQCAVIAPALMPRKPGERVKTNPRDASKVVELGRAGLLTAVHPPTPAEEAVRDLARARDAARADLQRCRHRLGKLLLRRGLHYAGKNWTRGHRSWIARPHMDMPRSGRSSTIICWRSIRRRRGSGSWMRASRKWPRAIRIARRSGGSGVSAASTR